MAAGVAAIDDQALSRALNSGSRAQSACIDAAAGASQFADLEQALDRRAHLALAGDNGLTYLARTATLDEASTPFVPPTPLSSYSPLDVCLAVLERFTGPSRAPASPSRGRVGYSQRRTSL